MSSTFPFIISPARTSGRALSLLSSKTAPWLSESELSSRSSAALRKLVFENRTAASLTSFASPVPASAPPHINCYDPYSQISGWAANAPLLQPSAGHHPTTLDLIRVMPNPSAEFMPGSNISRNGDRLSQGDFGDFWRSFPTHLL